MLSISCGTIVQEVIAVDTSVLVAVIANEPAKAELVSLTVGHGLLAPHSVHWEVGNALAAGLKRQRFSLKAVRTALRAYSRIPVRFVDVELDEAMRVADQLKIYAYDAYVLVCARGRRCPLLTLDRGLLAAANRLGIDVLELES